MSASAPKDGERAAPEEWRVVRVEHTYYSIELHSDGVFWLRRTSRPYASLAAVAQGYRDFLELADQWRSERAPRSGSAPLGFLYDVRQAPAANNDPAFEAIHHEYRAEVYRRTSAFVVLVRTATGLMQMARLGRYDGSEFFSTQDEEEALRTVRKMMLRG